MIVKAIRSFKDKYTGGVIPANVLLDIDPERAQELNEAQGGPYVEEFPLLSPPAEVSEGNDSGESMQP